MFSVNLGIDLGTANIRIFSSKKGVVLDEPTILARNEDSGKIIAYGKEAYEMLGRTPPSITAIRPLLGGAVSEYSYAKQILRTYIKRVCSYKILKPKAIFSIPRTITKVEKRSVVDIALSSGTRHVVLMHEAILSALGANLDLTKPKGKMIVNIGAGTLDIAVAALNDIVVCRSEKIGGQTLDNDIIRYIHGKYQITVGALSAEKIKIAIGTALSDDDELFYDAKGYSSVTELPAFKEVSSKEIYHAISKTLFRIYDAVQKTLEITPPELAGDIISSGIVLCGGGALLKNIDVAMSNYLGVECKIAENPQLCTVLGAGKALKVVNRIEEGVYDIGEAHFPLSNLIDL